MHHRSKLQFLGAAGTVTGSKTLLKTNDLNILVDAGLFQGLKEYRELNWMPLPIDAQEIDFILLTHAHLDHCGYLPRLVKQGFRGPIYCTPPTAELAEIVLLDSAKLQEEDARKANQMGFSRHHPALPLYTGKDARAVMPLFKSIPLHQKVDLKPGLSFSFFNTGHILGSAGIELDAGKRRIVFSGDLGRERPYFLYPREFVSQADYLICESTYGGRIHSKTSPYTVIKEAAWNAYKRRSVLMIPAFALERTQEVIYILHHLRQRNALPPMPIYLDSPMGISASELMLKYPKWHRLNKKKVAEMLASVRLIRDARKSRKIVRDHQPKIVLAGSGMLEGGRILDYLQEHITDPNATLLLVGFQAEGTRGRALLEGARELKFYGRYHPVKLHIRHLDSLSAHADQREIMDWLRHIRNKPKQIFLNHGEPVQADALRVKIKSELGWNVKIPQQNQVFSLD